MQNVETVMDKAVPIANNIEEVVTRAKAMSSDVEQIAHKVRAATEAMNGTFSGEALKDVAESLKTIAAAFGGGKPGAMGMEMPAFEFDLTKGRKR
jgi:division protein CdvB (Snf7/Vps24/ESCRT-III family)